MTISIQRNLSLIKKKNYCLVRTIVNQPYLDLSLRRLGLLPALFDQYPEQEAGKKTEAINTPHKGNEIGNLS